MSQFEFHSLLDIIKQLDLGDDAVVIGGQALNFGLTAEEVNKLKFDVT